MAESVWFSSVFSTRIVAEGAKRAATLAETPPALAAILLRDPPAPPATATLDRYVAAIVEATIAYDASGDHRHDGSPRPGDCVRCNVVEALPNTAVARIQRANAERTERAFINARGGR